MYNFHPKNNWGRINPSLHVASARRIPLKAETMKKYRNQNKIIATYYKSECNDPLFTSPMIWKNTKVPNWISNRMNHKTRPHHFIIAYAISFSWGAVLTISTLELKGLKALLRNVSPISNDEGSQSRFFTLNTKLWNRRVTRNFL